MSMDLNTLHTTSPPRLPLTPYIQIGEKSLVFAGRKKKEKVWSLDPKEFMDGPCHSSYTKDSSPKSFKEKRGEGSQDRDLPTECFRSINTQVKGAKCLSIVGKSSWVKEAKLRSQGGKSMRKPIPWREGEARFKGLLHSAPFVSWRLWLPDTELPPYPYLVAFCRNLSSRYCKKLLSGAPFSLHGFAGREVNVLPEPEMTALVCIRELFLGTS